METVRQGQGAITRERPDRKGYSELFTRGARGALANRSAPEGAMGSGLDAEG